MANPNDTQHGGDHYSKGVSLQHWDICASFGVGYLEGCASKYVTRWRKKNGREDLLKAHHYLLKLKSSCMDRGWEDRPRGYVPFLIVEAFLKDNGIIESDDGQVILGLFQWETWDDLQHIDTIMTQMLSAQPQT